MSLKPIYAQEDLRTGRMLWGLGPEDYRKVQQGYACPKCLEDYNGVYMISCPVCGHTRDVSQDFLETPEHFKPGVAGPAPEPTL